MTYVRALLFLVATCFFSSTVAYAAELATYKSSHSALDIHLETKGFTAGKTQWLAVTIKPKEHWHTYWKNYGDSGAAPIFTWSTPDGVRVGSPLYPAPSLIKVGPLANYGFEGSATLLVPLGVSDTFADEGLTLTLDAEWLVCDVECIPQYASGELFIPSSAGLDPSEALLFSTARKSLPEPSYWDSGLTIHEDYSDLTIFMSKGDIDGDVVAAHYFPEVDGIVSYAGIQNIHWTEEGLLIRSPRAQGIPAPTKGDGVLELTLSKGAGKLSFSIMPDTQLVKDSSPSVKPSGDVSIGREMPLWQAILFAFAGGLILNLMPCVFPVLSLKAISLAASNFKSKTERIMEGWAYTLGIWLSFMIIVLVLVSIRAGGTVIGWGFQLQSPLFVGLMVTLMVLVAASLFGVFTFSLGIEGAGQSLTVQKSHTKSAFFKGVLATLVATPCTAPLMAPAIGFALSQPLWSIISIFSALAFGLASPFLLLSYSSRMAKLMPKPGPWMETLKELLAFPMLLTACWLLYVFTLQTGATAAFALLAAILAILFALWMWKKSQHRTMKAIAALVLLASLYGVVISASLEQPSVSSSNAHEKGEVSFNESKLDVLRAEGQPVFLYFTAEWCITCKVNERVALNSQTVQDAFTQSNIVVMKGDWTNRNAEIGDMLASFGRVGVPLYIYYPAGGKDPVILPELLSPDIVMKFIGGKT